MAPDSPLSTNTNSMSSSPVRKHPEFHIHLKTSAGTALDTTPQLPPTPLHMPTTAAPVICPTCLHNGTYQTRTSTGDRVTTTCRNCLADFHKFEKLHRRSTELTSFPSLMEDRRDVDGGQRWMGVGIGTRVGEVYGSIGRVVGAGLRTLRGGGRGRPRGDSTASGTTASGSLMGGRE
ncbi:hypothetical protein BDV96DRAFT_661423 [Lophiotrema nucula]|uniref:Uncharacterized protein n=1 Tax=Lophiotrema nucula TaxID=690887 RepID=A0A6A5Z6Z6_9PLEO|nr:hypothetical protein BDV96DRAFT_661423 [Lophiotrema nucula]